MKKPNLFLSAFAILALASCGGGAQSSSSSSEASSKETSSVPAEESSEPAVSSAAEESEESLPQESSLETPTITLFDGSSQIVGSYYGAVDSSPLATYHHKDKGNVPYVELNELLRFLKSDTVKAPQAVKIADHLYGVMSDNVLAMMVDTEENTLTICRFDYLFRALTVYNNGVGFDCASPTVMPNAAVRPSPLSKMHGDVKAEVYDLDDYHCDIAEVDGKIYVPFKLLSTLLFRCVGVDFIYNGHDYFRSALNGVNEASCRTSNDTFSLNGVFHAPVETPLAGEAKRYVGVNPQRKTDDQKYSIVALTSDGKGGLYHASTQDAPIPEKPDGMLVWEEKEGDVFVGAKMMNAMTKEYEAAPSYFRIRHDQTYFNMKTRNQALAQYNYDVLRLQFDRIYGLKKELGEKQGYVDFDSFVASKGLKAALLSTDCRVYDDALAEFTMRYVDDGHTHYTSRSLFSGTEEETAEALVNDHPGARRAGLLEKMKAYQELRKQTTGLEDPLGYFVEGETAVIRFDSFMHYEPIIQPLPEGADQYPLSTILSLSTPHAFKLAFKEIEKNASIKNVVLDVTCNGGGMVMTLPYLASYFTKDPILFYCDTCMGVGREFHYCVDLNENGVYDDENDSYEGKYNFFILTSDFSFSCASALPAIAHLAGVKIIGKQSGGGACPVATFTDAVGSTYNSSSPMQIGYLDGEMKFVNNDAGVPVDYELDKESWYDMTKLNAFVSGLTNNQSN